MDNELAEKYKNAKQENNKRCSIIENRTRDLRHCRRTIHHRTTARNAKLSIIVRLSKKLSC